MIDLRAQLQNALGDAYRIEKELGGGGMSRVYLAKDACLTPETFGAMYPSLTRFQEIKSQLDPQNRFSSSLSRRLGITPNV